MGDADRYSLKLRGVSAGYDAGPEVLREIDAAFAGGRMTAVIGPNGAGKTTLARVLAGLLRPRRGRVVLGETDLWTMRRSELAARVAYLPQRTELLEPMTAAEVVALGLYAGTRDESVVRRVLERVGLWDARDEMYVRLSAGQQQRVSLARVMAQLDGAGGRAPPGEQFIVADEPASAQDPRQVTLVMRSLRESVERSRGVIAVVHDLTLAVRYADDVLAIGSGGEVAAWGSADEVLRSEVLERVYGARFRRVELTPGSPRSAAVVADEGEA